MATFSDDESVAIRCAKCGHENPVTIKRLERDPAVVCIKCGTATNFLATDPKVTKSPAD